MNLQHIQRIIVNSSYLCPEFTFWKLNAKDVELFLLCAISILKDASIRYTYEKHKLRRRKRCHLGFRRCEIRILAIDWKLRKNTKNWLILDTLEGDFFKKSRTKCMIKSKIKMQWSWVYLFSVPLDSVDS